MQPLQRVSQWYAGRSHYRRVEGMADRQGDCVIAGFQENLDGFLDRFAGPADNCLALAVDICDHHVAGDRFQYSLDFIKRCKHRCHPTVVLH